ncbi:ATP-dependent Clp protease ATP-binding subunit [Listeria monocytogenes]|nr:ATP-dependent Clp protease ATP-binding subunit [Listeria monocytogenes]
MEKILIFKGSKKDFKKLLEDQEVNENYTPFMELIRDYNATVRASKEYATEDHKMDENEIENVVIYADDFSSVTNHVITNFPNIVLLGHNIINLFIQNPPKRVETSIRTEFPENIVEEKSQYYSPRPQEVFSLYDNLISSNLVGQHEAKKKISVSLYQRASVNMNNPLVLMFYGPSGVGKTELAKVISEFYQGRMTRVQFSMMQTNESYKYIFGDEHAKTSFARDLLDRESNIILIDEFDKVDRSIYNVFYQMFDEGEFEDANYQVDVRECIFILTTNFQSDQEISEGVGMPIFSRIDSRIKFYALSNDEVINVIRNQFEKIFDRLSKTDQELVKELQLEEKYIDAANIFKNIRLLDKYIENDVYTAIFERKYNARKD